VTAFASHRILVVANETVSGQALLQRIRDRAGGRDAEVLVVCPALNSRLRHWLSDNDQARRDAQKRLNASLHALAAADISADGRVGDGDPVQAIKDALCTFKADEIIISTHPPGRSNWLEKRVVERASAMCDLPVSHVIVDLRHERAVFEPWVAEVEAPLAPEVAPQLSPEG
jgi:universal stress protein family protein